MAVNTTAREVAKYLRDFIEGTGDDWAWDDFTSIRIVDPVLDRIRRDAAEIELPVESVDRLRALLSEAETLAQGEAAGDDEAS